MPMAIDWNDEKSAELKARYGFGFDRILIALTDGSLLEDRTHPNRQRYGHQRQFIVKIDSYAWIVPFVQTGETIFLKTIFPSRKATKRYLEKNK